MSDAEDRKPDSPGVSSDIGGENLAEAETTHGAPPHDSGAEEPLGPLTPDDERPLGDTPEAHDEIIPEDLPKDHPGRNEAEHQAATGDGTVRGNT
ncbi:MAG TPA: hypothetical protein VNT03_22025 [Baekduia sp.]|nr:hypothetical protein [Baekduia sp.]